MLGGDRRAGSMKAAIIILLLLVALAVLSNHSGRADLGRRVEQLSAHSPS